MKEGIVDALGGIDEALAYVDEMKLIQRAQPGVSGKSVYSELKREMWGETLHHLDNFREEDKSDFQARARAKKDRERRERHVNQWEMNKSKL